ncbi:Alpha/Beta hydrolase protein [Suillus lakei]|nr:Alpha/Beta hydrolase protein [Suillus lakei]
MYECVHQPLKGLYLCYQLISTIFIRVPIWSLWYSLPSKRPRSTWSWGHAMLLGLVRHVVYISSFTGAIFPQPDYRALAPTEEAEGVWVKGVPSKLIKDELKILASVSEVAPERIPGYWYGRPGTPPKPTHSPQPGEKVFYFFHAGGFTHVSAHPQDFSASITRSLVDLDKSRFPFPAALLDCLSGYYYLVDEIGYEPSNIILVGASAGGNLALALCRYLVEHKSLPRTEFPAPPDNLLLLSPWVDIGNSHDGPGSSSLTFNMDFLGDLNTRSMLYSKRAFLGPYGFGFAMLNRYISPASLHPSAHAHFQGFPRTFIAVGTADRFLDQIRTLRKKMGSEMDEGEVTFFEAQDAVHDYLLFKWHPHRPATLKAIATWLSESP